MVTTSHTGPMMTTFSDRSPMPWGTYTGIPASKVPVKYFRWIWHNGLKNQNPRGPIAAYIVLNAKKFEIELEEQ
jgi:uncharacterized protein (DUF3820 family)